MEDIWTIYRGYMPPPLFSKVCAFPDMHEMHETHGTGTLKVMCIRYIGYDGRYMDDLKGIYVYFTLLHILLPTYLLTATYSPNCWQSIANTNGNFQKYTPQLCARRAHRNPPTYIFPISVGMIYPIRTYIFN